MQRAAVKGHGVRPATTCRGGRRILEAAKKLMTTLLKAISLLADNLIWARHWQKSFEIATDVRYFVVSKQLIFYRVDEGNSVIEILRVLTAGRIICLYCLDK